MRILTTIAFIFGLALTHCGIQAANATKCYSGTAQGKDVDVSKLTENECGDNIMTCMHSYGKAGDLEGWTFGCDTKANRPDSELECTETTVNGAKGEICYCKGSLCNSSGVSIGASLGFIIAIVATMVALNTRN